MAKSIGALSRSPAAISSASPSGRTLLAPRPFMVERGHWDGVAPDEWVAYEYAKVRRIYDTLGLSDRTNIEFFDGLHEINGQGTFEFLHKHLKWPKPLPSHSELRR